MPVGLSNLCFVLALVQMLIINIVNINNLCQPKHKPLRRYLTLGVSLVILTALGFFSETVFFLEGGIESFCLIGALLFFIPAKMEYEGTFGRIVEAVCTSWIYSFALFSIGSQLSRLVPRDYAAFIILVTQSVLFAIFYLPINRFVINVVRDMLDNLTDGTSSNLYATSALWLTTFAAVNSSLVFAPFPVAIVTLLCMIILVFLNYSVMHNAFSARNSVSKFRRIAYEDNLTGLPNRAAFFTDGQKLIEDCEGFGLVFLDLDNFKSINDTYGHLAGNVYLCGFSAGLLQLADGLGKAYRISGDEFAVVLKQKLRTDFVTRLVTYEWPVFVPGQTFLGVSAGYAQWPQDGKTLDDILLKADKAMYRHKRNATQGLG